MDSDGGQTATSAEDESLEVPDDVVPEEIVPEVVPDNTVPEKVVPEEVVPEEVVPEEVVPEDVVPEEGVPKDVVPEDGVPGVQPEMSPEDIVRVEPSSLVEDVTVVEVTGELIPPHSS